MIDEEITCSCGSVGRTCDEHLLSCDLWADDDWSYGQAEWDYKTQSLVWDLSRGSSSDLFNAIDDEIGGRIADETTEQLQLPTSPDVVEFADLCMKMEDELLAKWGDSDFPGNYTLDGVSRIWNPDYGTWETKQLRCWCPTGGDGTQTRFCGICMVWRPGRQNDGSLKSPIDLQWRPSIIRKDELVCRCHPPSLFTCKKCGVARSTLEQPFHWVQPTMGEATTFVSSDWGTKSTSNTTWSVCRHQARELILPNGNTIYGSSSSATDKPDFVPDFAFYLDKVWRPKTLAIFIPWVDMGLPELKFDYIETAVTMIGNMAAKNQKVEIGCIGGHGRTGTLMALVVMSNGLDLSGTPEEIADRAIDYVRTNYCKSAIESATQEWYIQAYYCKQNDLPLPEKPTYAYASTDSSNKTVEKGSGRGYEISKHNDGKGIWYCQHCYRDCTTDYDWWCEWCFCEFTNPGTRPGEEWNPVYQKHNPTGLLLRVAAAAKAEEEDPQGDMPDPPPADKTRDRDHFYEKGFTYDRTEEFCVKCQARLYTKTRWGKKGIRGEPDIPYRREYVHEKSLRKIRRCRG